MIGQTFVHKRSGIPMIYVDHAQLPEVEGYDGGAPGVSVQHYRWKGKERVRERQRWFWICGNWEEFKSLAARQDYILPSEYEAPVDPATLENVGGDGV